MTKLTFSDGITIDTSGPLRPLVLHDGWYVVGEGTCSPVYDREEALSLIAEITKAKQERCQHRDDGRGWCIDCGLLLKTWGDSNECK
jgi:hypothetical protein